jgi:hypothetical protein
LFSKSKHIDGLLYGWVRLKTSYFLSNGLACF